MTLPIDPHQIAKILADEDVMALTQDNPDPLGEYCPEANDIVRQMHNMQAQNIEINHDNLSAVVRSVFEDWFDERVDSETANRIAKRLLKAVSGSETA